MYWYLDPYGLDEVSRKLVRGRRIGRGGAGKALHMVLEGRIEKGLQDQSADLRVFKLSMSWLSSIHEGWSLGQGLRQKSMEQRLKSSRPALVLLRGPIDHVDTRTSGRQIRIFPKSELGHFWYVHNS